VSDSNQRATVDIEHRPHFKLAASGMPGSRHMTALPARRIGSSLSFPGSAWGTQAFACGAWERERGFQHARGEAFFHAIYDSRPLLSVSPGRRQDSGRVGQTLAKVIASLRLSGTVLRIRCIGLRFAQDPWECHSKFIT
jgi:hypothetical protein